MSELQYSVSSAMIAEDDDDDFEIFSTAVEEISIAIVITRVKNGDVLMKKLNGIEVLPDILFLDILMPILNGKDCLKLIRANKKFDALPIIMFSSVEDERSIEFCFREGSNLYLHKPYNLRELIGSLKKIFSIDWQNLYYPPISQFQLKK